MSGLNVLVFTVVLMAMSCFAGILLIVAPIIYVTKVVLEKRWSEQEDKQERDRKDWQKRLLRRMTK